MESNMEPTHIRGGTAVGFQLVAVSHIIGRFLFLCGTGVFRPGARAAGQGAKLSHSRWMRRGMSSLSILSRLCRQPCLPRPWATLEIASARRYAYKTHKHLLDRSPALQLYRYSLHTGRVRSHAPPLSKLPRGAELSTGKSSVVCAPNNGSFFEYC